MSKPKLKFEERLSHYIAIHKTVTDLMWVGNEILSTELERGHKLLYDAWVVAWHCHLQTGQVERGERWLYSEVKMDLKNGMLKHPLEPMHLEPEPAQDRLGRLARG
jgi:hypothetical protein